MWCLQTIVHNVHSVARSVVSVSSLVLFWGRRYSHKKLRFVVSLFVYVSITQSTLSTLFPFIPSSLSLIVPPTPDKIYSISVFWRDSLSVNLLWTTPINPSFPKSVYFIFHVSSSFPCSNFKTKKSFLNKQNSYNEVKWENFWNTSPILSITG